MTCFFFIVVSILLQNDDKYENTHKSFQRREAVEMLQKKIEVIVLSAIAICNVAS